MIHRFSWTFSTAAELDGRNFYGKMADYEGGGYIQNLGDSKNESTHIIADLKVKQ